MTVNGIPVVSIGPLTYGGYVVENGLNYPVVTGNVPSYLYDNQFEPYGYVLVASTAYASLRYFTTDLACFVKATRILTSSGERAVETLEAGDIVVTAQGILRPVRWIGSRFIATPTAAQLPVCISAGTFGPLAPSRDLYLSPDHAVFVDGILVTAQALVNGVSIRQVKQTEIEYFHILLDTHDVIFAEGLPCETFLDNDGPSPFDNDISIPETAAFLSPYAPRLTQGPKVDAIRVRTRLAL